MGKSMGKSREDLLQNTGIVIWDNREKFDDLAYQWIGFDQFLFGTWKILEMEKWDDCEWLWICPPFPSFSTGILG